MGPSLEHFSSFVWQPWRTRWPEPPGFLMVGVAGLIGAMERSITRANSFVESLTAAAPKALTSDKP